MKILILGDVSPRETTNGLFKIGDAETLFSDTRELFRGKDVCFINLECALTESTGAIKKFGPKLKGCTETAGVLAEIGVTVCGLSNNHIFDLGVQGYRDTVAALEAAGLDYTGFGENYENSRKNYIFEKDGEKIAIIAVCEREYSYALPDRMGSRPFDPFDTLDDIRKCKSECDKVIVIYHGGKEYCKYPSPRLHRLAHAAAEAGADLFVTQHSHCIGCYEKYLNCHILYGQGNFHFIFPSYVDKVGQGASGWGSCLAIEYDTETDSVEFTPVVERDERGITLAKGEAKERINREFAESSARLTDGTWRDGWHEFAESKRESYTNVIKNAYTADAGERENNLFAHYLDCEAHTDVWRELFPTYNLTNEK